MVVLKVLKPIPIHLPDGRLLVHNVPGVTMDPLPDDLTNAILTQARECVDIIHVPDPPIPVSFRTNRRRTTAQFELNRAFSQQFVEHAKEILGRLGHHFISIVPASEQDDMHHATDLTLKVTRGAVGFRVRSRTVLRRDFTIQSSLPSGAATELQKLLAGYTDFYLYGWQHPSHNDRMQDWMFLDMECVRKQQLLHQVIPAPKPNPTGECWVYLTWGQLDLAGAIFDSERVT